MNKVIMTTTLCADPEVKTYGDDKKRVTFNGAVAKRFKKDDEPDNFFQFVAFGYTADFIAKYFKKGSKMLIEGEINNNNYEKDGVKVYGQQILINNVEFYGKKSDNANADNSDGGEAKAKPVADKKADKSDSKGSDDGYYDAYADF